MVMKTLPAPDVKRGWFAQCGSCGGNAYVKNAALVRDTTCERCRTMGTAEDEPFSVMYRLVVTELGWCACGNPEDVDAMMLAYLRSIDTDHFPRPQPEGVSKDAAMLLAYIADDLDWTEHGTSIGGSWLTEAGREALRNLAGAVE